MNNVKSYKLETLYLAVSLADRYLVNIAVRGKAAPDLINLGITCILMAAKLEEPVSPSFDYLIKILKERHQTDIAKQDLLELEEKILIALEFACHHVSPIPFIERYFRVFGIDNFQKDKKAHQLRTYSRQYCRFMQREPCFLNYCPSQIAAAALLLAINISSSNIARSVGLKNLDDSGLNSLFSETSVFKEIDGQET